ncbi:g8338 [Coccomyxa elongata]
MSRTPEHDFLRAVGTPLPKRGQETKASPLKPAKQTSGSVGTAQCDSGRHDIRSSPLRPADNGPTAPQKVRSWRVSPWATCGALAGVLVVLIIVLLRQVPHQAELPEAASFALEQWQQSSGLPELPEGATCDAEDKTRELKKLLMHTQQQLKESQERLRQAERDARPPAAVKKRAEACEGKLREATSGHTQQAQELTQKLQQAEQAVRTAHARLKDRDRLYLLLQESAAAAEARVKSLETDLGSEAAARAAAAAAAEAAQDDLSKAKVVWEHDRAGLVAAAASSAAAAAKKVEELEGSLAECRGRVAGLGEGCGRCWQMLDEAQGEGRAAKMHAATIATGLCGLVAGAAYIYSVLQRQQISYLKLEGEKLRCAAFEAQNGVRQRMSRAGSATRLPAQQINPRIPVANPADTVGQRTSSPADQPLAAPVAYAVQDVLVCLLTDDKAPSIPCCCSEPCQWDEAQVGRSITCITSQGRINVAAPVRVHVPRMPGEWLGVKSVM